MAEGTITKQDLFGEGALDSPLILAANAEIAIEKNKELVKSAQAILEVYKQLKTVQNESDFKNLQTKQAEIATKATAAYAAQTEAIKATSTVWKEQDQLEKQLISTKIKNSLATESTNRALIAEREALRKTNAEIKTSLTTMGQLIVARDKARKSVQDYQAKLALGKKLSDQEQSELLQSTVAFSKYDAAIRSIKESTGQFQENVGNYPAQLKNIKSGIQQLIPLLGTFAAIRVGFGIIRDGFNEIVDFDRQLIAVGKTTNITGDDLKNFGRQVVNLGRDLEGVSVEGLLKTSEVAGTLGVKGTSNILQFATAVERLKLTSDIISDEQVQNFAQFIEVSQDSFENADRLASVMTQLGNNTATTEAKILSNATEIQKGVSIYNASAQGVLGLGAATSALGSEAETSRTAIQKTFAIIDKAIFSGEGLEQVLALTGLTQKELSEQFKSDATGVFVRFIKGLSDAKDAGKNLNKTLIDVGISDIRATTVVGALSANYDVLANSVALATAEYEANTTLLQEVGAATESVSSIVGDIKDNWAAYVIATGDANDATSRIASVLKFVRDNLTGIIEGFLKYGAVLLTYIGVLKAVNLVTATFIALKQAAAVAELNFAIKTGIGRQAVLAQATAVKAAAAAQTGLNVAMTATPWGVILAALAAVIIAYKVFNNELSEQEKLQKKVNDNIANTQELLKQSAENSAKFYGDSIKQIEDEFALRRAKSGESLTLDKEELESKKKLITNFRETNAEQLAANNALLKQITTDSTKKIRVLEEEATRLRAIADSESFYGHELAAKRAEKSLEDAKLNSANQKNNLILSNKAILSENDQYTKDLLEIEKASNLKLATEEKEAAEESKKAREKARAEREAFNKRLIQDKLNLQRDLLKAKVEDEQALTDDEKRATAERLLSNQDYVDASIKLMDFEKGVAISNSEGRADEIKRIEFQYSRDYDKLLRERQSNAEEILKEAFENAKKNIEDQNDLQERGIKERIAIEEKSLSDDLLKLSGEGRVKRLKEFEDTITQIELDGSKERLENQIQAIRAELENPALNPQQRLALEQLLSDAKIALSNTVTDNALVNADKQAEAERKLFEFKDKIIKDSAQSIADSLNLDADNLDSLFTSFLNKAETTGDAVIDKYNKVAQALSQIGAVTNVTGDIFQAVYQRNIEQIDEQIDAVNQQYERQYSLAEGDAEQQDLIRQEQQIKIDELEAKKREEQVKAAKFAKAQSVFQIGLNTAQAILGIWAQVPKFDFGVSAGLLTAFVAGLGALQIGAVLAKPIPKYEHGTQFHPGGYAEVAERRPEMIHEPGKKPRIQYSRAVLNLQPGTKVYPTVKDGLEALKSASVMESFVLQNKRINQYETNNTFDINNEDVVRELVLTRQEIRRSKVTLKTQKIDLNHELFRAKNTNWSS